MRTLTISELEAITGVPRGTIYHYIKEGLIPPSLETGRRAGLYTEQHAMLLARIRRLRRQRARLSEIRDYLRQMESEAPDDEVDLAAKREASLRARILAAATRRFTEKGYRKTGVDEIIAELEIAPGTLYRFFPTKKDLFVHSMRYLISASALHMEPHPAPGNNPALRNLGRVEGLIKSTAENGEIMLAARAEALGVDEELEQLVRQTYADWLKPMIEDFRSVAADADQKPVLDPELVSYALLGSSDAMLMRMSWDERYSQQDVLNVLKFVSSTILTALGAGRTIMPD